MNKTNWLLRLRNALHSKDPLTGVYSDKEVKDHVKRMKELGNPKQKR